MSGNFGYIGRSNPWGNLDQMRLVGRYGGRNHVCNISWLSVKGCECGERGKFAFSHWLDESPLQHWSHYGVTEWWIWRLAAYIWPVSKWNSFCRQAERERERTCSNCGCGWLGRRVDGWVGRYRPRCVCLLAERQTILARNTKTVAGSNKTVVDRASKVRRHVGTSPTLA